MPGKLRVLSGAQVVVALESSETTATMTTMATALQDHPRTKRTPKKRNTPAIRTALASVPKRATSDDSPVPAAELKRRAALLKKADEIRAQLRADGFKFLTDAEVLEEVARTRG